MSFCPICGRDHDPNRLCIDIGGEALRRTGVETNSESDNGEFMKISKQADRYMLKLLLKIIIGFILVLIAVNVIRQYMS